MSDISTLSKQYNTLKETSENITDAVMLLKKHQVLSQKDISNEHKKLASSDEEIDLARQEVLKFLLELNLAIKDTDFEGEYFSKPLSEKISSKMEKEFNLFEKTLGDLLKTINISSLLSRNHFNLLNKLLSALDNERAQTFRKLRTSRR